jgi:hypothetical protein
VAEQVTEHMAKDPAKDVAQQSDEHMAEHEAK